MNGDQVMKKLSTAAKEAEIPEKSTNYGNLLLQTVTVLELLFFLALF